MLRVAQRPCGNLTRLVISRYHWTFPGNLSPHRLLRNGYPEGAMHRVGIGIETAKEKNSHCYQAADVFLACNPCQ